MVCCDNVNLTHIYDNCYIVAELCAPSIPFHLMADLFDSITIDKCEDVFKFVEENVSVWKSVSRASQLFGKLTQS